MPTWVSSPAHRSIIASLVAARIRAGMTQRDVAAKLGKPPSLVGKIESIERNLSILEFLAYCGAVSVDPAEIIAGLNDSIVVAI